MLTCFPRQYLGRVCPLFVYSRIKIDLGDDQVGQKKDSLPTSSVPLLVNLTLPKTFLSRSMEEKDLDMGWKSRCLSPEMGSTHKEQWNRKVWQQYLHSQGWRQARETGEISGWISTWQSSQGKSKNQKDDFSICNCVWVRQSYADFKDTKREKVTMFWIRRSDSLSQNPDWAQREKRHLLEEIKQIQSVHCLKEGREFGVRQGRDGI